MPRLLATSLILVFLFSCSQNEEQTYQPPFRTVADVHELMEGMVAPLAQAVFESVSTTVSEKGIEEFQPRNAEEWEAVEHSALGLAESANLLMLESRAVDKGEWIKLSEAMIDRSLIAAKAAEAQDKDALFDAAGGIYEVCQACHMQYIKNESQEQPAQ